MADHKKNFVSIYWTLGGLFSWVMYRDLEYSQEFSEEGKTAAPFLIWTCLPREHGGPKQKPLMFFRQAKESILHELQAGSLVCTGMRNPVSAREVIPPLEWVNNDFSLDPDRAAISKDFGVGFKTSWESLRFKVEDALVIWPNLTAFAEYQVPRQLDVVRYSFALNKTGGFWNLRFGEEAAIVKNLKGMGYLQFLLKRPGERINVELLDPALLDPDANLKSFEYDPEAYTVLDRPEVDFEVVNERTAEAYRQHETGLLKDLEIASATGNEAEMAKLENDLGEYRKLKNSVLANRGASRLTSGRDKIRSRVSQAITRSMLKIADQMPGLDKHLNDSIKAGTECIYAPKDLVDWRF